MSVKQSLEPAQANKVSQQQVNHRGLQSSTQLSIQDNRHTSQQIKQLKTSLDAEELSQHKSVTATHCAHTASAVHQPLNDAKATLQAKNNTGLPDNLKSGMENLSGMNLSHVKVHYNSPKPAAVQAHAFAQGSDIHISSGQEKHLPHELGHVVQQAQGRVKPTTSVNGMPVNDNSALEKEADVMGANALQAKSMNTVSTKSYSQSSALQLATDIEKKEADIKVDALKARSVLILEQLKKKGEDWKKQWGDKAKQTAKKKTKDKLNGKKGKSLQAQITEKLWNELSAEEKARVFWEGTKGAVSGFSLVAEQLLSESGQSNQKEQPSERVSPSQVSKALGTLSELSADDIEATYEVIKKLKEANDRIENIKKEIVNIAGKAGGGIGRFVGEVYDEHQFEKLITSLTDEFQGAKEKYIQVKAFIDSKSFDARYEEELTYLSQALFHLRGPGAAVRHGGQISAEARLEYPELCDIAISNIKGSSRKADGIVEGGLGLFNMGLKLVGAKGDVGDSDESKLAVAQEHTASALKSIVRQDWGKVTKWVSTPSSVKKIIKIGAKTDAKDYLTQAKVIAIAAGNGGGNRNVAVTQALYDALKAMDVASKGDLSAKTVEIHRIAGLLSKVE